MNAGWGISPWNLVISPVKSGGFHRSNLGGDFTLDIQWISPWNLVDFTCEIWQISWNLADFRWNPPKIIKASVSAKTLQFDECRVGDFTVKSGGFHLWNLVDFTQISPVKSTQNYKSKCFSKNSSVWWMQGGGFHPRNPMDFTHEIWQISPRFHLWNPPKIIKASVSAKTLQFDECRVGTMTKDFMKSTRFHPEIWWISPVKSIRVHPDFIYEIHPKL